jgi:phosphate transport system substrate-binding protein
MNKLLTAAALLLCSSLVGTALATYADQLIAYGGAGQGKVVFDGRTHAGVGLLCIDCHPSLFPTRKQALITMADHTESRGCFSCSIAFAECAKCHRK